MLSLAFSVMSKSPTPRNLKIVVDKSGKLAVKASMMVPLTGILTGHTPLIPHCCNSKLAVAGVIPIASKMISLHKSLYSQLPTLISLPFCGSVRHEIGIVTPINDLFNEIPAVITPSISLLIVTSTSPLRSPGYSTG